MENRIPETLVTLMSSDDAKVCWIAVRAISLLIPVFAQMKDIFTQENGKPKIIEILKRKVVCRALLIALVGLMRVCDDWTEEETSEVLKLIREFEGYETVKQLMDYIASIGL
jgi:hypothetical protein